MHYDDWHTDFFWTERRTPPTEYNLAVRYLVIRLFNKIALCNGLPFWAIVPKETFWRNECLIFIHSEEDGNVLTWDLYNEPEVWKALKYIFSLDFDKYIKVVATVDDDLALKDVENGYIYTD